MLLLGTILTTSVLTPNGNVTVLPSADWTNVFRVWTPNIVRVMLAFAGDNVAVAVAVIELVVFRLAMVKLAVAWVWLMNTVRVSGVTIRGCWMDGGRGAKRGTTNSSMRITTTMRNAHIGTGRLRKLGRFSSAGTDPTAPELIFIRSVKGGPYLNKVLAESSHQITDRPTTPVVVISWGFLQSNDLPNVIERSEKESREETK